MFSINVTDSHAGIRLELAQVAVGDVIRSADRTPVHRASDVAALLGYSHNVANKQRTTN